MPRPITYVLFALIEIILLPITMISYVWLVVSLIRQNRRTGMSSTAYSPLGTRWLLHASGARQDPATQRLLLSLTGGSFFLWRLVMWPTFLAARLSGFTPSIVRYPLLQSASLFDMFGHRTTFFDSAMRDYLDQVKQVIILGAGWDTRAYNIPKKVDMRVFEVDTAEMQQPKQKAVQSAGIDTTHVTFVSVDFNKESWFAALKQHGFNPDIPTLFLWEGVIYYLEESAVHSTLDIIGSECARGSAIAFDYLSTKLLRTERGLFSTVGKLLQALGEPLQFGISTGPPAYEHITKLLATHNLEVERYEPFGNEGKHKKPFGGLVVARTSL